MDIYTMDQWKTDRTFSALPGQEIEEAVYNELFNCMPPLQLSREAIEHTDKPIHAGFMMGEPHSSDQAGELFLAFGMNDYGKGKHYYYLGQAHKERKLQGSYFYFENVLDDNRLVPVKDFTDVLDAIRRAADQEETLYRHEYQAGELVSSQLLYQPRFL